MSDLLAHVTALGLLVAAFWLCGYAAERGVFREQGLGPLRGPARFALGALAWMVFAFGLATLGLLRVEAVWLGLAVSGACAALARTRWPGSAEPHDLRDAGFVAALLLLTLPFLAIAATPDVSWDASAYHLSLPKRFVAASGFVPVELNVYASWPLGTELLFAVAMLLRDYVLAKLVHFAFGLLTLFAVYCGCRAFHGRASAWLAVPLVLANATFLFELGVAYVDLAVAFYLVCAVLFAARALEAEGREARRWLLLAGLCGGALASTKVTGVVAAAAAGAVLLPQALTEARAGRREPLRDAVLCFGLPVLLLWLPWLAKSALTTGNPVHPFLYGVFGGPDWSPGLSEQFTRWQQSIGMGRAPLDWLLLPVRVVLTGGGGYDRFHGDIGDFWIVLVPVALLFGRRHRIVRCCLGAAALTFLAWAVGSQQVRLLLPILPLLAVAAAIATVDLLGRIPLPRLRRSALVAAPLAAFVFAFTTGSGPVRRGLSLLGDGPPLSSAAIDPVHRFVASQLDPDARLLLLNTNQVFFLERDALADSFFEASQIADWLAPAATPADVAARLRERRITHVLVSSRSWGIAWPPALLALLDDRSLTSPRYRAPDGRFELLELR